KKKKQNPDRYWSAEFNFNGKTHSSGDDSYGPDVLQNFALDFIRRHKAEPFFLYYPSPFIHAPILSTPDSAKQKKSKGQPGSDKPSFSDLYADNIQYLDKQMGQLADELDRLGIRENTLLIFAGDNGSSDSGTIFGKEIDGSKSSILEGGSRVPLIASWPGTVA